MSESKITVTGVHGQQVTCEVGQDGNVNMRVDDLGKANPTQWVTLQVRFSLGEAARIGAFLVASSRDRSAEAETREHLREAAGLAARAAATLLLRVVVGALDSGRGPEAAALLGAAVQAYVATKTPTGGLATSDLDLDLQVGALRGFTQDLAGDKGAAARTK